MHNSQKGRLPPTPQQASKMLLPLPHTPELRLDAYDLVLWFPCEDSALHGWIFPDALLPVLVFFAHLLNDLTGHAKTRFLSLFSKAPSLQWETWVLSHLWETQPSHPIPRSEWPLEWLPTPTPPKHSRSVPLPGQGNAALFWSKQTGTAKASRQHFMKCCSRWEDCIMTSSLKCIHTALAGRKFARPLCNQGATGCLRQRGPKDSLGSEETKPSQPPELAQDVWEAGWR